MRRSHKNGERLRVVELFAGVGGFHLAFRNAGGFEVVWSNQWEPGARDQFASNCYEAHFGSERHVCDDIERVLDVAEGKIPPPSDLFETRRKYEIPSHDLLVGGFPCQDYSVAKPLNQAHGIIGKKGVLWWQIYRLLKMKADSRPRFVLLENVDRLLKSPGRQRGRDFAIILSCFRNLGYAVEWRVVNAADYGFPQKRRRVFMAAQRTEYLSPLRSPMEVVRHGILGRGLPVVPSEALPGLEEALLESFELPEDPHEATIRFGIDEEQHEFKNAGMMVDGMVYTIQVTPESAARDTQSPSTLGEVVARTRLDDIGPEYFIPFDKLDTWRYLKGAKNEARIHKESGAEYFYTEGALPFPDPLDRPARTVLTGEGGSSPSRFKHVIQVPDGRFRRLIPDELEELNGFPRGWTKTGMTDIKRAFCMGNALVVGVVEKIGKSIAEEASVELREVAARR